MAIQKSVKIDPDDEHVFDKIDMTVKHDGTQIILPGDPRPMDYDEAIKSLQRMKEAENKLYNIAETVHCHFYDGLVALAAVLKERYGFAETTDGMVQTFFGKMRTPPVMVQVRTGPGPKDFIQVPLGGYKFPGVNAEIIIQQTIYKSIPMLQITGSVKKKERAVIAEIIYLVQEYVKTHSIYRGNAIILDKDQSQNGIDYEHPLEFFDPHQGMEAPIFDRETEKLIETVVMAPIVRTAAVRKARIPLKRGILLSGPYGTGKSLVSKQIAKTCVESGWTFILVTDSAVLKYALTFAKLLQPCVVFAEDIDRSTGTRNTGANDLLNHIDGVVGKNDEIMTVLTTNHADRINKAMLRPGRLDAVVALEPPKADGVARLVEFYAGGLLEKGTDLTKVIKMLGGQIPAMIREVVERSKLSMIAEDRTFITGADVEVMALSMANHQKLLDDAKDAPVKETLSEALTEVIVKGVKTAING